MKKINKTRFEQLVSSKKELIIADMRSPVSYRDGHIVDSVNLPLRNFINKIMGVSKDTTIIAYSTNFSDVDLTQGMNYAEQLGFKNLYMAEYDSLK